MTIGILAIGYTGGGSAPDETTIHRKADGKLEVKTGNGANQAVLLTAAGKYPAVDGSLITNIPTSTSIDNLRYQWVLNSGATVRTVTTAGNPVNFYIYSALGDLGGMLAYKTASQGTPMTNAAAASGTPAGYNVNNSGTAVNGDYILFAIPYLPAGTYNLKIMAGKGPSNGKMDVLFDGGSLILSDRYQAAVYTNVELEISTGAIAAGQHTLKLLMNGKNASSAQYDFSVSEIFLEKTA